MSGRFCEDDVFEAETFLRESWNPVSDNLHNIENYLLIIFQSASSYHSTLNHSISYFNEVIIMELGLCLRRIDARDNTLTHIIVNERGIEAVFNSEPVEFELMDDSAWFEEVGSMIAALPNLNELTFDGIDPDVDYLGRFWGEVSASISLTSINFVNMNLEFIEEIFCIIDARNISNVMFRDCILHHEIGYVLNDDVHHHSLTTLRFDRCRFANTNTMREIIEFAGYIALLPSITSVDFSSCALDAEQLMCLVRSLPEERVRLELGLVQVNFSLLM